MLTLLWDRHNLPINFMKWQTQLMESSWMNSISYSLPQQRMNLKAHNENLPYFALPHFQIMNGQFGISKIVSFMSSVMYPRTNQGFQITGRSTHRRFHSRFTHSVNG